MPKLDVVRAMTWKTDYELIFRFGDGEYRSFKIPIKNTTVDDLVDILSEFIIKLEEGSGHND